MSLQNKKAFIDTKNMKSKSECDANQSDNESDLNSSD